MVKIEVIDSDERSVRKSTMDQINELPTDTLFLLKHITERTAIYQIYIKHKEPGYYTTIDRNSTKYASCNVDNKFDVIIPKKITVEI